MRIFFLLIIVTILLLSSTSSFEDKNKYPQDYFRSPVDHPIKLSGTFGELRPNHLHAGIDIKSRDGKVGQPLFAVADGYVSRIKIQSGGYGNVLYVNHPNGYTSVYAHLYEFPKAIANYVKEAQYQKKSFGVELFPQAGQFSFKKGERIGKLGTSGRSFGPHLHFEIRDTKTEKPINPLLFGLKVKDNIAPKLHQVKVYFLNDKRETQKTKTFDLQKKGRGYGIKGDTLNIGAWRVGLALKAYDHHNNTPNWNGVYSIEVLKDDQPFYDMKMETFPFSETRYINAHLDYAEQISKKSYLNRCYTLPGNRLSIYGNQIDHGVIPLQKNRATKITMIVKDVENNTSTLEFWVKRKKVAEPESPIYNYVLRHDEENIIDNGSMFLSMKNGTLYENLYMKYHSADEQSTGIHSQVHHVHDLETPVHKYFDIGIRPDNLPEELRDKAFVAYCGKDKAIENYGGKWKGDKLQAKVRDLGDFCIMVDTQAPTIKPIRFKSNMRGASKMTFEVKENFETSGNAKQLIYNATVDGKWILMEYDAKNDLLIHRFDGRIPAGKHTLRLEVSDHVGNKKVYEREFTR